jgi:hypothetical protein
MPAIFDAVLNGTIDVDQVQIELHVLKEYASIDTLFAVADRANFWIFYKERNHWGCSGYKCVGYGFVSASFLRRVNSEVTCNQSLKRGAD